ncbi:MAG TPA: polysaccharide deacetylase family protein [Terricaulis sp.]|nr:polysaccharide deacetylase family protein [Terricaulis sp.]HRP11097.1 polysaccharide deacetylase family protein [Terricaulis sp.]
MKHALKSLVKRVGVERRHVEAARMFAERHALASAPRRRARPQGRILCYHSVGQPEFGVNDVTPQRFRAQIEMALGLGYRFVAPAEIAKTGGERMDLAVSFDDALKSVLTEADPILSEYKIPYTVFAVAEWSDQEHDWQKEKVLSWEELGDMRARGVEVGSHSATHRNFGCIDEARARDEFSRSIETIERRLGFRTDVLAIPFGQSMNWNAIADRCAREAGFTTIYAQAEETRPEGTIARTFVTHYDDDRIFKALLAGAYDRWEEWTWMY